MALRRLSFLPLFLCILMESCSDRSLVVADSREPSAACRACTTDEICMDGACHAKGVLAAPVLPACIEEPCINVYNNCPLPLFIHAVTDGSVVLDNGTIQKLNRGEHVQYARLPAIDGGRVYAYYTQPSIQSSPVLPASPFNQFIEVGVNTNATTGKTLQSYSIAHVDSAALPVSLQATGGCRRTVCGARLEHWKRKLLDCPTELRNVFEGVGTCMGSYNYCITRDGAATYDTTRTYCTKMSAAHGYSGSEIYGGVFPDHGAADVTFWNDIAAWNRGTYAGNANASEYYLAEPYNDYARWIHRELGCDTYAFSTDNHQIGAGSVQCFSPELDVIFCPYD